MHPSTILVLVLLLRWMGSGWALVSHVAKVTRAVAESQTAYLQENDYSDSAL